MSTDGADRRQHRQIRLVAGVGGFVTGCVGYAVSDGGFWRDVLTAIVVGAVVIAVGQALLTFFGGRGD